MTIPVDFPANAAVEDPRLLAIDQHQCGLRLPHVELITVEGGEHAIVFTDRDLVRTAVSRYLRSRAPSR